MKKNIIKISVFLILLFLCLGYLTNLLERKYSANKLNGFFDEKENFDVLFFGTSHLINSVYPMQLYNDYGIISYNMGNNSSNIPTTYWILKMALNYKKPKLVVIDCYSLSKNYKIARNDSLHNVMDGYPLSLTKIKAVLEQTEGKVIPAWLDLDKNTSSAKVVKLAAREDIDLEIKEHLIVELYSK